jgi:hypothetical protein
MVRGTFLALAAAALLLTGCMSSSEESPVVGGYTEVSTSDPDVNAAAQFAVTTEAQSTGEIYELSEVISAEQQVVAGMNYRLVLLVIDSGASRRANADVFRDLDGAFSLTSWVWDTAEPLE